MFVSKVCLLSAVLCVVWFGAVHCQQQGLPPWLASLWLPGASKSDFNKMNKIGHYPDSVYKRVLGSECEIDEIKDEVREAEMCLRSSNIYQPTDDGMEGSIKPYCDWMNQMKNCYIRMANKIRRCLDTREKLQLDDMSEALEQLTGYLCDHQGKRLSQFFAEGGSVCFEKLTSPLLDCMKGTNFLTPSSEREELEANFFETMFEKEKCKAIESMRDCVVGTLRRHCDRPTPADMMATMMDILIKGTPCKDLIKPSAAAGVSGAHALLAVAAGVTLLLQPAP